MNEAVWLPALVVLAAGLILGLLLAIRIRSSGRRTTEPESADLELELRDLEARRDDLFRRLRAADEDRLSGDERSALEEAAAVTLREIDSLQGRRVPQPEEAKKVTEETEKTEGKPAAPAPAGRSPMLTGFVFGAVMVLVIGLLVYWAVRDAQPRPDMGGQMPSQANTSMEPPHEGQAQVPPEVAAQISQLQQQVTADPEDWMAKKQLALTYVAAGQFFEAFEQASQILVQFPNDPDALLVHGIVRMTMGQADQAVGLLDRVLAEHPDHRQALIYRGLALYQMGNVEQAMDTWETGLQMAGGSDPELEELLMMAQTGRLQTAGMSAPAQPAVEQPVAATAAPARQLDPESFPLQIEIAADVQGSPQAVLFVFLRPEGGGAPVAATRISSPTFPLAIALDVTHSMMGAELPDRGIMVARLDTDGNVTTSDPTDLVVELPASKGQVTLLTLGQ